MESKPTNKPEELFTIAKLSLEDALETLGNVKTMGVVLRFTGAPMTQKQKGLYIQSLMQAHTNAKRSVAMIDNLLKVVAQDVQHGVQQNKEERHGDEQEGKTG